MRSAGNFNSEWGYLAPAPSLMRTVRVVLVATAIGATAGAAVVLSLIDRPSTEHERTASIAAHAIVTSVQAAPATAVSPSNPATAALAPPVSAKTLAVPPSASTAQAQSPVPDVSRVKAAIAAASVPPASVTPAPVTPQVAMRPPEVSTPPAGTTSQATSPAAPQAALSLPLPSVPLQASVAINPAASDNSVAGDASAARPPKPASGYASLSDTPPATEAVPVETQDQALIPPQTVPPVKKQKPHAAYASNARYQPTPSIGTVLRRLFSPHTGTSYYPNR
jgi:hypothetical protein